MDRQRPYSHDELQEAKGDISHAEGYKDKGLRAYAEGLKISIETFKDFEGMRVLDLGSGAHLQFARGLESAGIKADTVSFSPAFADTKRAEEANPKFELVEDPDSKIKTKVVIEHMVAGMGEELPFADGTFNRIVCLNVVEHLGTWDRYILFLNEIVRVLAPNGIAYIGPTKDFGQLLPAHAVSKEELEEILNNEVEVTYHSQNKILRHLTLTLRKKNHD